MKRHIPFGSLVCMLLLTLLITSCVPQRRLRYFRQDSRSAPAEGAKAPAYIIAPHDLLHVQIFSASPELNKIPGFETGTNMSTDANIYLQGYPVSPEGKIILPLLGEYEVKGMTIEEFQSRLTLVARQKISLDAEVMVRLVNFRISVLGEVKNPGIQHIYEQRISVLEALAQAGDITAYGNREKVMLIRENEGKKEIHTVDLTDRALLSSPLFYLNNNDILYVQPLDAKTYGFGQVQWGVIFSTLSTILAILAIVLK